MSKDKSSTERVVVRLRLSDQDENNRIRWLNRLTEAGCNILSVGRFGLDVEMDEKSISDLLGLNLVLSENHHGLELQTNTTHEEGLSVPDAYIPTKPTRF